MAKKQSKQVGKTQAKKLAEDKKAPEKTIKTHAKEKVVNDSAKSNKNEEKNNTSFKSDDILKYVKIALPIIFILIAFFVAYDVRIGPHTLDGLDKRIEANTYANIKNIVAQQIDLQYPDLNAMNREDMINDEYQKVIDSGSVSIGGQEVPIDQIVTDNQITVKQAFQAENGQTYLNAIDPYHFLRLSELNVENGYPGDTYKEVDGKEIPWVSYKLAPNGVKAHENPEFHIWLMSFIFKTNGLDSDSPIGEKTKAIYLIPVIFAMLSIIPLYFIIRHFSNDLFAFFGSIFLVTVGIFVSRTVAGFVDTDAYNVFFPLIIVAVILWAFLLKNRLATFLVTLLAGILQGIYLWAWIPGWFIFVFILASLIGYLFYVIIFQLIKKASIKEISKELINDLIVFVTYLVSSYILIYLFIGRDILLLSYQGATGTITEFSSISQTNIWPNVLSSVAELNSAGIATIINSIGGKFVFLIALFGIMYLLLDSKKSLGKLKIYTIANSIIGVLWFSSIIFFQLFWDLTANNQFFFLILLFLPIASAIVISLLRDEKSDKIFLGILLSIWVSGTIFMSFNGQRFVLLLSSAFAISFAIGLYYISKIINDFITEEFRIENQYYKQIGGFIMVAILFFILVSPQLSQANAISDGTLPNFDDAWYSTMEKIKDNTSEGAIITSWWDFGHFFAATSKRGVTFDGGSQGNPVSHWVGKLLLENDERKSADILRMLSCGSNGAFDTMYELVGNDNSDAVKINKIIYETLGKSKEEKAIILANNKYYQFSETDVISIMEKLHCEVPNENIVIASEDMVGKGGVWAHWGSWDFSRKYVLDNYNSLSSQEIAENIDEPVELIEQYIAELNDLDERARTQDLNRRDLVNQWLAPYPGYVPIQGQYLYPCQETTDNKLVCNNGVIIDMINQSISLASSGNNLEFSRLIYPDVSEGLAIMNIDPSEGKFDVTLIPTNNGFSALLSIYPLGASTFTKLFYLSGYSTTFFESFDRVTSVSGQRILTYRTNWEAHDNYDAILEEESNQNPFEDLQFNNDDIVIEYNYTLENNSEDLIENITQDILYNQTNNS